MPGTQNCTDSQDPGFGLTIGFKDWEDIDKVDLAVDVLGIVGEAALVFGGPAGAAIWFFSEIPELMTIGKSLDQLESGDPSGVIGDTAITVAQSARLIPAAGWIGNLAGIAMNVLTIDTIP